MSCEELRELVDAHVDGELDLVRSLEVEKHLEGCAACRAAADRIGALRSALRSADLYAPAPRGLEERIGKALRREAKVVPAASRPRSPWRALAVGAVAATFALFASRTLLRVGGSEALLTRELVSSHVRSLMADHLTDVASSDRHTVKPWFDGKVDFSPEVRDFGAAGFPLVGGRLDYLDRRPVAALVYRRERHVINLFVWPEGQGRSSAPEAASDDGYNVFHWSAGGMSYVAVSDLNARELAEFAALVKG